MKVWELEENEEYTSSGGIRYKKQLAELWFYNFVMNQWKINTIDLFVLFGMDFTKIEKAKPKTEIVFHEYFNTNTKQLFWSEKINTPNGITSYHKPTGETVTRKIEL